MNLKQLVPSYRNRYLFVKDSLEQLSSEQSFKKALNLGSGEGDFDPMISNYVSHLISCDLNSDDIEFAKKNNAQLENVNYEIQNALNLSHDDQSFDLIICIDVIEHVGKPEKLMDELKRVLKPNGYVIMTYPTLQFPVTYDPINYFRIKSGKKKIPIGAFAYGHEYLIDNEEFRGWCQERNLHIIKNESRTQYISSLSEMYWMGMIQKVFKSNSGNASSEVKARKGVRPTAKIPGLVIFTDFLNSVDRVVGGEKSQNQAYILKNEI